MSTNTGQPVPQGRYVPAVRHAATIYTSGMTPRKAGKLMFTGKIHAGDPLEIHREAVRLATFNALTAASACLGENEKIGLVLQLQVFLNTDEQFSEHSKIADFASAFLVEKLGVNCIGTRTAVGVASLPSNAPVEIALIAKVV